MFNRAERGVRGCGVVGLWGCGVVLVDAACLQRSFGNGKLWVKVVLLAGMHGCRSRKATDDSLWPNAWPSCV